jgi:hypothetical protein
VSPYRITVLALTRHRISRVRIEKVPVPVARARVQS